MNVSARAISPDQWMDAARAAYQAKDVAQALTLSSMIEVPLGLQVDALGMLAGMCAERGDINTALLCLDKVIASRPDWQDACFVRGNWLMNLGRQADALASYDMALQYKPDHPACYNNRGMALKQLGRLEEATQSYQRALSLLPGFAQACSNLGSLLGDMGQLKEAKTYLDKAVKILPSLVDAHNNLGIVLGKLGQHEKSVASFEEAIRLNPGSAEVHNNYGHALQTANQRSPQKLEEARASYERALSLSPQYAQACSNLGTLLGELNKWEEGLSYLDRAIELQPDFAEAHNNRGILLGKLGRQEEAFTSFKQALQLNPNYAEAYNNYGYVLQEAHRYANAAANFDKAIALMPDYVAANFNKGLLQLLTGNFSEGWPQFEWRWKIPEAKPIASRKPQWKGDFAIEGKTILLHAEQGLGDTLQFVRYVPMLHALGAKPVLQVQKPLIAVLASMDDAPQMITQEQSLPAHDCHVPLMSLPLAFKTELSTIPAQVPYIKADATKAAVWQQRLQGKRAVGLVWAGNSNHKNNHNRSIVLATVLEHAKTEGVTFVALQKDITLDERELLAKHGALQFADELKDFSDTAALIEALELVISVDTSVAHLAGAMGKPLWILLPFAPDFRWLVEGETTPWYPTAKLFRQSAKCDWVEVLQRVASTLKEHHA